MRGSDRAYLFHALVFAIGGATIETKFKVSVQDNVDSLIITADIDYTFKDRFKDPLDIFNVRDADYELPGGKPFDIIGEWSTRLEAKIKKDK